MTLRPGRVLAGAGRTVVRLRLLVLLLWVAAAVALSLAAPSLSEVVSRASEPVVPDDAPSVAAFEKMDQKFGGSGAQSVAFVVFTSKDGLSQADHAYYTDVVHRLQADDRVTGMQDIVSHPELAKALTSDDGKAIYLPVGLSGGVGSPDASHQVEFLRHTVDHGEPDGLRTYVTGSAATITDLQATAEHSITTITVVIVAGIAVILLLIYRSLITAGIALATIGVAVVLSHGATAYLGLHLFDVSTFTESFVTAVVLGAGTDYSVFLIGRYHEERRSGTPPLAAVSAATGSVASVVTASAVTVVAASLSMALAQLGIFSTAGPAIAVSIMITLLVALTFTPALLALAAKAGRAEPTGRDLAGGIWAGAGSLVARRPARVLLAGLIVLAVLASFYPTMRLSYDQRAAQPAGTESNHGYDALAEHFPANEVSPDYVLITADHDLRTTRDLAALEKAAHAVSQVHGVRAVRGVTRPAGEQLRQASLSHQAGTVGDRLAGASHRLATGQRKMDRLSDGASAVSQGADRSASGAATLASGASRAVAAAEKLLDGLRKADHGVGQATDGAAKTRAAARKLADGADELAGALRLAHDQTAVAVAGLGRIHEALRDDPLCTASPTCERSREALGRIYRAQRDRLLPGLAQAAGGAARIASGNDRLGSGLDQLAGGLHRAEDGLARLTDAQSTFTSRLGSLSGGAHELAGGLDKLEHGTGRVANGTDRLVSSTQRLQAGLARAAEFLQRVGTQADNPAADGYYLPAAALDNPRMALARSYYLSEDGHAARLIVLGETDPYGNAAMHRVADIQRAADQALQGTSLAGSDVAITGPAASNADLSRLAAEDFTLIAVVALLAVFAILILLLRCLVAPLYLMVSVIISYAAAMGIGVLVWQYLLGTNLDWSVPLMAFVILVAVGADYNILLIARVREETATGSRAGIARAVTATGGVITAAGVIFAVSFFAMMAGAVTTLAQTGFTIGIGLLLDTFIVRTLVVPSVAALAGRWNWWPAAVPLHDTPQAAVR